MRKLWATLLATGSMPTMAAPAAAPARMIQSVRFGSPRPSKLAALFATLALGLVAAAPVSAATVILHDTITLPITESGITDACRAGITGTASGTDVIEQMLVDFPPEGVHVTVTDTSSDRISWTDGSYTLNESVVHISFVAKSSSFVFTNVHQDFGPTYSADGTYLFRTTFQTVEKVTIVDGVLRAEIDRGHFNGCHGPAL